MAEETITLKNQETGDTEKVLELSKPSLDQSSDTTDGSHWLFRLVNNHRMNLPPPEV